MLMALLPRMDNFAEALSKDDKPEVDAKFTQLD
jgi:hypothetical protein